MICRISCSLRLLVGDHVGQEIGSLALCGRAVQEMGSLDLENTLADHITVVAEDLGSISGVFGNAAIVLLVQGVAEENGAFDLLARWADESGDGRCKESGSLAAHEEIST